jgi:hypothetical protein
MTLVSISHRRLLARPSTAKTMHEVERIKALRQAVAKARPVAVASFESTVT